MKEIVLAESQFEAGADILKNGEKVYRIPACTNWDDDAERVIDRDGEAVVQLEIREYSGNKSFSTDVWKDVKSLGRTREISVVEDHHRGCQCEECR